MYMYMYANEMHTAHDRIASIGNTSDLYFDCALCRPSAAPPSGTGLSGRDGRHIDPGAVLLGGSSASIDHSLREQ